MTVAGLTGLTLGELKERVHERRLPWLERVVFEELECGRIVQGTDGLLRVRPEAFDDRTLAALRQWEPPA